MWLQSEEVYKAASRCTEIHKNNFTIMGSVLAISNIVKWLQEFLFEVTNTITSTPL